jgi:hypothetical protein
MPKFNATFKRFNGQGTAVFEAIHTIEAPDLNTAMDQAELIGADRYGATFIGVEPVQEPTGLTNWRL